LKDLCRCHFPTGIGENAVLEFADLVDPSTDVVAPSTDVLTASAGVIKEPTVICEAESEKMTNIAKTSTRIKRGVKIYDQKRTIEYPICNLR
jgi:hypothetical protein